MEKIKKPAGGQTYDGHPYRIDGLYFIRTVTHHFTGKLLAVYAQELVLEGACWIADDGRLGDALVKCEFNEVEPYPPGVSLIIGRGSIIDASEINKVPVSQR